MSTGTSGVTVCETSDERMCASPARELWPEAASAATEMASLPRARARTAAALEHVILPLCPGAWAARKGPETDARISARTLGTLAATDPAVLRGNSDAATSIASLTRLDGAVGLLFACVVPGAVFLAELDPPAVKEEVNVEVRRRLAAEVEPPHAEPARAKNRSRLACLVAVGLDEPGTN